MCVYMGVCLDCPKENTRSIKQTLRKMVVYRGGSPSVKWPDIKVRPL